VECSIPCAVNKPVKCFNIKIGHLNINSLRYKTILLSDLLYENDLDVFCISETKLDGSMKVLNIPGYYFVRRDRTGFGGGVGIYLKSIHRYTELNLKSVDYGQGKIESISIKVQIENRKSFIVCSLYRPKFSISLSDLEIFENYFEELHSNRYPFYICGDFNIHLEETDKPLIRKFNSLLNKFNLVELVQKPTRGNARLDLIITNNPIPCLSSQVFSPTLTTDHEATVCVIPLSKPKPAPITISFRAYDRINYEKFVPSLINSFNSNNDSSKSLGAEVDSFIDKLISIYDEHAPILKKKINPKSSPKFLTTDTRRLKAVRNKLISKNKLCNNANQKKEIYNITKLINKSIHADTKQYYNLEISNKGLWSVVNKFLRPISKSSNKFDVNDLNNHYFQISNAEIHTPCPIKPLEINVNSEFKFQPVSTFDVIKAWRSIKNKFKTTPDQLKIAPIMLQKVIHCPSIIDNLTYLINRSLLESDFVNQFKISAISPVPKISNPIIPADYRPISVQSTLSKLTEKCAYKQLINYLDSNDLLYKHQYGFRKGHSCEHAMLALIDFIQKQIDIGYFCILVSLDLSKAFDVIVREFFIQKLTWYGIDPKWFQSYLTGRCQYVKGENGTVSVTLETKRGCPQGSVNGPLIFSIYINDLPLVIQHCLAILFADDTQLCIYGKPNQLDEVKNRLISDLNAILKWMNSNGMSLNVKKTQMIVIGNSYVVSQIGRISLDIDNTTITSADTLKSLGLTIDCKLKWDEHISNLCKRYHATARSLYPLKSLIDPTYLHRIFNSYLLPITNYMILVWGTTAKYNLKSVNKLIRTSARFLLNVKKFDPIKALLTDQLNWMLAENLYQFAMACFVHKIKTNDCPVYFQNLFCVNESRMQYNIRGRKDLYCPIKVKGSYGSKSFSVRSVKCWNLLSPEYKSIEVYKKFKEDVKKYFLSNTFVL